MVEYHKARNRACEGSKTVHCRALELEESERLANENIKDIIAVGFDPENTFIFSDFQYVGGEFYRNMIRIQRQGPDTLTSLKNGIVTWLPFRNLMLLKPYLQGNDL